MPPPARIKTVHLVLDALNCTIYRAMQPNSDQTNRGLQVPSRDDHTQPLKADYNAAANVMRQQIDKIYDDPQPNEQIVQNPTAHPYQQSHSEAADVSAQEQDEAVQAHWQKYHSAWQQYYQMYYERYYQAQVAKQLTSGPTQTGQIVASTPPESLSKDQAVDELRSELLKKVRKGSEKIRRSRHFMPAVVAGFVALLFVFLQYNQLIFANVLAFTAPASTDASNSFIDPSTDISVGPEPLIKIPKINVEAPVVYDISSIAESVVQSKLKSGVVHYPIAGASAFPGQVGNTVFLGHSANDVFDDGQYKFIFLYLDRLVKGDTFYLNYEGKRYTYIVTETKVINPSQVGELVLNNGKPMATLVTCTPAGTALNRLIIIGEQVAPDPATATAQSDNQPTANDDTASIGGATKGFFERVFGSN